MDNTKQFTAIEWCAGYGGIHLGLKRAIPNLRVIAWPTIRASEYKGTGPFGSKSHKHRFKKFYLDAVAQERLGKTGRLNPYYCEWLMGVQIGWTACVSSATESSQPQQSEHLEF